MLPSPRLSRAVLDVLSAFLDDPTEDRYGLPLMRTTSLPSGTLYPILSRLERGGWVQRHWEDLNPAEMGRPARRYYRLTPDGLAAARAALAEAHRPTSDASRDVSRATRVARPA